MNRYSVLALSLILMMFVITSFSSVEEDTELTGYAEEISHNEKGTTFWIHDIDGVSVKAFSKEPIDGSLHIFRGDYSSDGGIFFVDKVE